jgi:AcrR family transcriptional regulator
MNNNTPLNPDLNDSAVTWPETSEPRLRLLEGMAKAVTDKGYANTTIADIVREAGVSRRTFYEQFTTKADCLVASYEVASRHALTALQASIDPARSWQTQITQAMTAYLECLASNPVLMRTLFVEILGLGTMGMQARRRVNREIADFMCEVINRREGRIVLSLDMAMAVVGGVNELVLQAFEQDRLHDMAPIAETASTLIRAIVALPK